MIDASTVALHETVIRLAKGVVTARERHGHAVADRMTHLVPRGALAALFDTPTAELKASIGVWESTLRLQMMK